MVRTRLIFSDDGKIERLEIQRAKFKHWFPIGKHRETNNALKKAIMTGQAIEWPADIKTPNTLF